ncbi:unnamed protein product [Rodentolepis nana]|uniref:Uncharacterized protein n=1 Tax=Rodentolepis nana TaxID=102285 RepID=A0A0R3TN97_RODNA|nr:unnamed protein product [Rodentolepis nana]
MFRQRLRRKALERRTGSLIVRKMNFGVQTDLSFIHLESSLQTPASEMPRGLERNEMTRLKENPKQINCCDCTYQHALRNKGVAILTGASQFQSSTRDLAEDEKCTGRDNNENILETNCHELDLNLENFTNVEPRVAISGVATPTGGKFESLTQKAKLLVTVQKPSNKSRQEAILDTQRSRSYCDFKFSSRNRAVTKPLEPSTTLTNIHFCRTLMANYLTTPSYMTPTIASVRKKIL